MGLCNNCIFYSERADELNRNFNDVGAMSNHYCPMYKDTIPYGIYNGDKDCEYYEEKGVTTWNAITKESKA